MWTVTKFNWLLDRYAKLGYPVVGVVPGDKEQDRYTFAYRKTGSGLSMTITGTFEGHADHLVELQQRKAARGE